MQERDGSPLGAPCAGSPPPHPAAGRAVDCLTLPGFLQRQGEPTAEAIANAATARPGRTENARDDLQVAAAAEEPPSAAGGGATDKDEKVNRRVARGPDGTRGFHTTESGARWTGSEAWVQPEPELDAEAAEFIPGAGVG